MLTPDADGRFVTAPLPVGQLALLVSAPERQSTAYAMRPIRPGGKEDLGPIRLAQTSRSRVSFETRMANRSRAPRSMVAPDGSRRPTQKEGLRSAASASPSFQMSVHKEGYFLLVGYVTVNEAGLRFGTRKDMKPTEPAKEALLTLKRLGLIEGSAVDADTGEPVRLQGLALREFQRKPSGEAVLGRVERFVFEQPEPGKFRIAYTSPDEYNLTFSAAGYHDAEVFTPKVTELKTIGGIVGRLKRKVEGSTPTLARQTMTGTVTRNGRPLKFGWVGLCALHRERNPINAPLMRGRMVVGRPAVYAVPIREGSYSIDIPFQVEGWYVVVEEPGHALTQVGPIAFAEREEDARHRLHRGRNDPRARQERAPRLGGERVGRRLQQVRRPCRSGSRRTARSSPRCRPANTA